MFRLPSWFSESLGVERLAEPASTLISDATLIPTTTGGWSKRKRDFDADVQSHAMPECKRRMAHAQERVQNRYTPNELARIRQAIENQFSLETLLKHKELRLIEQELAKCQVALEQLRRCHLVPYPAYSNDAGDMLNVMQGTGPAVAPKWAPPYGVVDGPYSRHYTSFLRSDPRFDGIQPESPIVQEAILPEGRSTRNSIMADSSTGKQRPSRAFASTRLQALPTGYPQAKSRNGPCVIKRQADDQMVKLVCIDCQREDFHSTQGFINHCRIAHHRDYKSHEEAAVGCGQPVKLDAAGFPMVESKSLHSTGLVHPLITRAPPDRAAYSALLDRIDDSMTMFKLGRLPGISTVPTLPSRSSHSSHPSFAPSTTTPHLSQLLRDKGFAGNVSKLVDDAKIRISLDDLPSLDDSSDEAKSANASPRQPLGGNDGACDMSLTRVPRRTSHRGTPSRITITSTSARPAYPTPIEPMPHSSEGYCFPNADSSSELSPHASSSNHAPSLISDDDEYDDVSDDDAAQSEELDDESDVAEIVEDHDVEVEKVVPRGIMQNKKGKDARHVTFVGSIKSE